MMLPSVTTPGRSKQSVMIPSSSASRTSINSAVMNKHSSKPKNNIPTSASHHSNVVSAKPDAKNSNEYMRGIVIAAPNKSSHGWIYCKSNNAMYQLLFDETNHYIPQQIVLFKATNKLRGLTLTEARGLMMEGKLNIKLYQNYFVNEKTAINVLHTKLIDLDQINKEYLNDNIESMSNQNAFIQNTFVDLRIDNCTEFKLLSDSSQFPLDKLINTSERYLNGFINANGGTLYFGINANGRIIGQDLYDQNCRNIIDQIQLKICERLREWKPRKYVQKLINSVKVSVIDMIKIDEKENVGYVIPNKKIFKIAIDAFTEDITFSCGKSNNFFVYIRQLNSLCAYTDKSLQCQIGKRQIEKLNKKGIEEEDGNESDIDFDDDDEKGWIDVDELREGLQCDANANFYFDGRYAKKLSYLLENLSNALPII